MLWKFLRLMIGRESDIYQGIFLYQPVLLLLALRVHRLFRNLDQFEVILIGLLNSKGDWKPDSKICQKCIWIEVDENVLYLPTPPIYPSVKIIFKARGGRCKWDRAGAHFPYIGFNAKHAFREIFAKGKILTRKKSKNKKQIIKLLQITWTKN